MYDMNLTEGLEISSALSSLMRVVSMDEASNLFRACFCHGDASVQNAEEARY